MVIRGKRGAVLAMDFGTRNLKWPEFVETATYLVLWAPRGPRAMVKTPYTKLSSPLIRMILYEGALLWTSK